MMPLISMAALIRAELKPVTMMARSNRYGIARYVLVLSLCELVVYLLVSISSPGSPDHSAVRVNGAPPIMLSTSIFKKTPSRSIPILGSTAAAFTHVYGQPISRDRTQQGHAVLRFQDEGAINQLTVFVMSPTEMVVMITLQAEDGDPWNAQTAETVCSEFAPGDATPIAPAAGPFVSGDEAIVLDSHFLASAIQAYLPPGTATGNAGRFTVTLVKVASDTFSGCTLSLYR